MKKTILILAALACTLSCDKNIEQASETNEIVFTTTDSFNATVETKATTAVTSLNSFYAMATTGTTGSESALWNSYKSFSKVSNDTKYTSSGVYWPAAQQSIHFYASNLMPDVSGGDVTVNASTGTDVVCAYSASPAWKEVNQLVFNHILARLGKCTITAPTDYTGSDLNITIRPKISGTYNLRTGAWSSTSEAVSNTTITNTFGGGGTVNDIYLLPGEYTINASYTLTRGTYSESFNSSATVELAAGKINLISGTLPAGNATDLQFTVTVTPWSNNSISANFQ